MMCLKIKTALLFISIFILGVSVQAQSGFQSARNKNSAQQTFINSNQTFTEKTYTVKLKKELPFILSSLSVFTAGTLLSKFDGTKPFSIDELNNLNIANINSLDQKAINNWSPKDDKISDYSVAGISLLPILFLSKKNTRLDFVSLVLMSLEVYAFNSGTTSIIKSTVNRTRPYVYNTNLPLEIRTDKESQLSFYSGHTSHTAAATYFFAKVMNDYHPEMKTAYKIGMWTLAVTVPAAEGYLRVKAGKHFPTDAIAGYAMGAITGFLIPELHCNSKRKDETKNKLSLNLFPNFNTGIAMNMNLQF